MAAGRAERFAEQHKRRADILAIFAAEVKRAECSTWFSARNRDQFLSEQPVVAMEC
jgi:hypothetical protein